jgi:hypothetical protein
MMLSKYQVSITSAVSIMRLTRIQRDNKEIKGTQFIVSTLEVLAKRSFSFFVQPTAAVDAGLELHLLDVSTQRQAQSLQGL